MNEISITDLKPEQRPIVMMFQQPLLFPHMTVLENVIYGLKHQKIQKKIRIREGKQMLKKIEMEEFEKRYPHQLSGGQQQRVALARALIMKPQLLLLDEPFSSLDPTLRASIRDWTCDVLKGEGVTAIYVTHDREEAMRLGDRIIVMKNGQFQQIGPPHDVYRNPKNKIVAKMFSDGIVIGNGFVPNEKLSLSNENIGEIEGTIVFEALITGRIFKFGLPFYQIKSNCSNKEITVHSKLEYRTGEEVFITITKNDIIPFQRSMKSMN